MESKSKTATNNNNHHNHDAQDERFAVTPSNVVLFASKKEQFMPGVRVRFVEFRNSTMTQEQVQEQARMNKVFSYWEIANEADEEKMFENMSLQSLYKRPPPVWIHPVFLGQFGDTYISGTGLESNSGQLYPAVAGFALALDEALKHQQFLLAGLSPSLLSGAAAVSSAMQECRDLSRLFALVQQPQQLIFFLKKMKRKLEAVKEGEAIMLPGGIMLGQGGVHPLMYVVERGANNTFRFVLINSHPLAGLAYHQIDAQHSSKMKFKLCLAIDNIR